MTEHVADPWLVIGIVAAFLAGLLSLFAFIWLRTLVRETSLKSQNADMSGPERLEYYERQLIDLRIRMDALELGGLDRRDDSQEMPQPDALVSELAKALSQLQGQVGETSDRTPDHGDVIQERNNESDDVISSDNTTDSVPKNTPGAHAGPVDHVLHLITSDITTSRDIQAAIKKSREHTSRLLKKMYEDGYLERNDGGRPYKYAITPKGLERLKGSSDDNR